MFSSVQNTLNIIPVLPDVTLAMAVVSPIATMIKYWNYPSSHAVLQGRQDELENIKVRVNGLSVERRREIERAARRGACKNLLDVELEWERYVLLKFVFTPRF